MTRARRRINDDDGPQGWLERAAHKVGRVRHALAEGTGRKPAYVGKELSVVSSHVAMLAQSDAALDNPSELIRVHGMAKIDEMRMDDTIHGIERGLFKTALKRTGRFVPAEDDPEDTKQHAAFMEWNASNMQGSLKKSLEEILLAVCYGFTPTERVLDYGTTPFGQLVYLKALKTRKPHDFNIKVDAHGNIMPKGLYQNVGGEIRGYDLTPGEGGGFILYSYDKEFDNWLGKSAFGAAYRSWFCKKWFIDFQSIGIERFANAIPEIIIDLNLITDTYEVAKDRALELLKGLQTDSHIVMPTGYTLKLHELQGGGLDSIKDAILLHSGMIATALLVPEQAGFTQVKGGSYAKADSQMDLWMSVVEELQEDICEDIIGDQLIRVLIDLNWGPQEQYPTYEYDELDHEDKFEWCRTVAEAVKGKVITNWTIEREEALCRKLGLPMLPEDVRKLLADAEMVAITESVEDASDGGGGDEGTGGGGTAPGETPTEDESEEAGTPEMAQLTEFPADVFRMATGSGKARERDAIEASAIAALAAVAKAMQDDQLKRVDGLLALPTTKAARKLKDWNLKNVGEIRRIVHAMLLMATLQGKKDIREFIKASKATNVKLSEVHKLVDISTLALIPAIVRAYFKGIPISGEEAALLVTRAFDVAGGLSGQMLKEVKQVIYDALRHGDSAKCRMELRRVFQGYLDTGELKDAMLTHPWRIETIVRNNVRDAYSRGRLAQLEDPDVADVIVAYANTVIYDDNTTEICESGMEGPFDKDDYNPPGYHHACRTIGPVPIFEGERHEKKAFPHEKVAPGFDN